MKKKIFAIILLVIILFLFFKNFTLPNTRLIVIDAGHGGLDGGATSVNGYNEKDLNLMIAKKLYDELVVKGYEVELIRDEDIYVDNFERAKYVNKKRAKAFISIHCNAAENKEAHGAQVLYKSGKDFELAKPILNEILFNTGAVDKGLIERNDLIVLNKIKSPSIIVECGFLTNGQEANLLINDDYQNKLVYGIADGLEVWLNN